MGVVTTDVATAKLPDIAPVAIVTWLGGVAAGLFDVSLTITPPARAGSVRLATPFVDVPPTTVAGFRVRLLNEGGPFEIVSTALTEEPLQPAVMVACVGFVTTSVVTLKLAKVPPLGITFRRPAVSRRGCSRWNVINCPPDGAGD